MPHIRVNDTLMKGYRNIRYSVLQFHLTQLLTVHVDNITKKAGKKVYMYQTKVSRCNRYLLKIIFECHRTSFRVRMSCMEYLPTKIFVR